MRRSDGSRPVAALAERPIVGLRAFVAARIRPPVHLDAHAVDVGTGTSAFGQRVNVAGWHVEAVDREDGAFAANHPFRILGRNQPTWDLDTSSFDFVTAIEMIEADDDSTLSRLRFLRGSG